MQFRKIGVETLANNSDPTREMEVTTYVASVNAPRLGDGDVHNRPSLDVVSFRINVLVVKDPRKEGLQSWYNSGERTSIAEGSPAVQEKARKKQGKRGSEDDVYLRSS